MAKTAHCTSSEALQRAAALLKAKVDEAAKRNQATLKSLEVRNLF